jgi:hypothetical protein
MAVVFVGAGLAAMAVVIAVDGAARLLRAAAPGRPTRLPG